MGGDTRCLLVGFARIDNTEPDVLFRFAEIDSNAISAKELIAIANKILDNTDIILVNTNYLITTGVYLTILLQYAYINNTPIFGVGNNIEDRFLSDIILRNFKTVDEALDHYKTHYM
jgi:hypothetical protein